MSTISMILAWTVCGIIALVGGGVVGMVLANLVDKKRRHRNLDAWRGLTGRRFATRGPGKGKKKSKASEWENPVGAYTYITKMPSVIPGYGDKEEIQP